MTDITNICPSDANILYYSYNNCMKKLRAIVLLNAFINFNIVCKVS